MTEPSPVSETTAVLVSGTGEPPDSATAQQLGCTAAVRSYRRAGFTLSLAYDTSHQPPAQADNGGSHTGRPLEPATWRGTSLPLDGWRAERAPKSNMRCEIRCFFNYGFLPLIDSQAREGCVSAATAVIFQIFGKRPNAPSTRYLSSSAPCCDGQLPSLVASYTYVVGTAGSPAAHLQMPVTSACWRPGFISCCCTPH